MKNSVSSCSTCGAKLEGRYEYVNKGQIATLAKFRERIINKGVNSIHLQKEIALEKSEYTNFQKLRYNGLVAHAKGNGCWLLTKRGARFLRNEIFIPKGVLIFRNRIQKYHLDRVNLLSIIKDTSPYWYTKDDYEWEAIDIIDYDLDKYDFIEFDDKGQGKLKF
jgi:hypothetical protein